MLHGMVLMQHLEKDVMQVLPKDQTLQMLKDLQEELELRDLTQQTGKDPKDLLREVCLDWLKEVHILHLREIYLTDLSKMLLINQFYSTILEILGFWCV